MKNIAPLLFIIALTFPYSNLKAQRLTLGAKGGMNSSSLTGTNSDNPFFGSNTLKIGKEFGIHGELHVTPTLSYSIGIEYSTQGGLNKFTTLTTPQSFTPSSLFPKLYSNFSSDINLNYILFPVLIRQRLKINTNLSAYGGIGPCFGLLVSANRDEISDENIYTDPEKKNKLPYTLQEVLGNSSQKLNGLNLGLNGILGLSYKLNKKEAIFIEMGIYYGMSPIQNSNADGTSNPLAKMISFGYAYTLKEHYKNRYRKAILN